MNTDPLEIVLSKLSHLIHLKYGNGAVLSIMGGRFIMTVKTDLGVSTHTDSKDPHVIAQMLVPRPAGRVGGVQSVDEIYAAYPRKRDIGAARNAIRKALNDVEIPCQDRAKYLLAAVRLFAAHCQGKETQYIPYPASWMNRKSYLNNPQAVMEFLASNSRTPTKSPASWQRSPPSAASTSAISQPPTS